MADAIRVLHVDDDADFADMTASFLEREDDRMAVATADSATDALERVAEERFDCIVADYDMPDLTGVQLLEHVREDYPDLPFVLFTGKGSEEVASEAISAGVTDYLQKEHGTDQYAVLANRINNAVQHARSERRGERSERRLREVVDLLPYPLYVTDAEGRYLLANEALAEFHGTSVEALEGANVTDVLPPDAAEQYLADARAVLEAGEEKHVDRVDLTGVDGERRVLEPRLLPVEFVDADEAVLGIAVDVTEREERERERRRNERRFEAVFEDPQLLVGLLDTDGTLVDVNRRALEFIDAEREDVVGRPFPETPWWTDEVREDVEQWVERAASGEYVEYEEDLTSPDGERYSVSGTVRPVTDEAGEVVSLIVSAHDVTERRERERDLERYRRIFEAMGDGLYTTDAAGNYTEVNEQLAEMVGYDREEFLAAAPEEFLGEEGVETFEAAIADLLASDDDIAMVEATAERSDGETFQIEATLTLITDDGEFRGTIGVVRDVTDRKEREQELERYETIVRTIPDVVAVLDIEGRHEMINNMGRTGYTREELIGSHFEMTTTEEASEKANRVVRELLTGDEEKATFEQDLVTRDGEHIPHETHLALLPPDEDGRVPGVVAVLRDISDRKARERELERQNERLEEFASVVSHDLRNPLNVAAGNVDLLGEECEDERIGTIQQAHDRMEQIIEDTLTLARQGQTVGETERVQLAALAEECWRNVDTRTAEFVHEPVTVVADPDRLRHLLENLFRNAVEHGSTSPRSQAHEDSVEHGGDRVTVRLGPLDDGFYVEDTGPGIPESEREEVLEAGYSTSEGGTGFGLTIVRQIGEAHGWDVRVMESSEGGARFEFTGA